MFLYCMAVTYSVSEHMRVQGFYHFRAMVLARQRLNLVGRVEEGTEAVKSLGLISCCVVLVVLMQPAAVGVSKIYLMRR